MTRLIERQASTCALARSATAALLLGAGLLLASAPSESAVPAPGKAPGHPIALIGATVHTVGGPTVNETLILEGGRIAALGSSVPMPNGTERVDVSGRHIYPGLVDPFTRIGLTEIDAVRATRDLAEVGDVAPNVQAQVAINPESELIPVTRSNGVLIALTAPVGGLICGSSALLMLDGWTWQDMTLRAPVALHIHWPAMAIDHSPAVPDSVQKRQTENRDKALHDLRQAFDDARAYRTAKRAAGPGAAFHKNDQRWEAMIPVLEGRSPVIVAADEVQQIEAAVAFASEQRIRIILYGGYDAMRCAELLKKLDVPVIVSEVHRLPMRRSDPYDDPFTLPERLHEAGVRFCIAGGGGAWNERNLPYQAATAVAYGLPRDEALKAITLYPAEILGASDRIGSIAVGKDATLIVTDGDPFETTTHVERAFIQGREVDLGDRQKTLYEKYREKYRRLGKKQ